MKAWLFDVDGVLTNPAEKKVMHPEIFDEIVKRLEKGEPIGLNTGRSIDFVIEQVLIPLEEKIGDKNLLNNVIAIGEKGGVWITYESGERVEKIDGEISVPQELEDEIRILIEEEFSDLMFFDDTKKTMVSTEMKKGENLDLFHQKQQVLVERMREVLEKLALNSLKIDPTTIATDIENSHVGKHLGARRFLRILEERDVKPQNFIAFGDSASDFDMLGPLKETGIPTLFVFVGTKGAQEGAGIINTSAHFDEGTLEYLQKG